MIEHAIQNPTIEDIRAKVKECSYCYLQWDKKEVPVLLDLFTASALITAYDSLKPENQEKMARMINASKDKFLRVHQLILDNL